MNKPMTWLVVALVSTPALSAEAVTQVVDKIVGCGELQDTRQRLACFDREIAPLAKAKASVLPAAPVVRAATAPAPAIGHEQLGIKAGSQAKPQEILQVHVASILAVEPGVYLVSLDNSQVWRHEDEHQASYLRAGDAVTIRKGVLGNYRLTRDAGESKNWIGVTRVR